jgi:hypothetical protein
MPRRERLPGAPQPCLGGVGKDPGGAKPSGALSRASRSITGGCEAGRCERWARGRGSGVPMKGSTGADAPRE